MAVTSDAARLADGVASWNSWRIREPSTVPDLSGVDLRYAKLAGIDFHGTILDRAVLTGADLKEASLYEASMLGTCASGAYDRPPDFTKADLRRVDARDATFKFANLHRINLSEGCFQNAVFKSAQLDGAIIRDADLRGADLRAVDFSDVDLRGSKLCGSYLYGARFIDTILDGADLSDCQVFGVSAWNVSLEGTIQRDLVVTRAGAGEITVDNLEIVQFIYLLLTGDRVRKAVDAITRKAVLILGRFTSERKHVLDEIRNCLRAAGFVPMLFDFTEPTSRDMTETISLLAHLSQFIIADLTDAKSVPQELSHIIPSLPSVPVLPIVLSSERVYGMFEHFARYPWVMAVFRYDNEAHLITSLRKGLISDAQTMAERLMST